jgi:NADH-quinone oxidoreductase subunit A
MRALSNPYFPLLFAFVLAIIVPIVMLILPSRLGTRRPSPTKLSPYECGIPSPGAPRERFHVKFYLVAILFLLFDVEVVFLFPWAVAWRSLGAAGLVSMLVFLVILTFGLLYVWKRGALEWD